jgi:hypothetical protein
MVEPGGRDRDASYGGAGVVDKRLDAAKQWNRKYGVGSPLQKLCWVLEGLRRKRGGAAEVVKEDAPVYKGYESVVLDDDWAKRATGRIRGNSAKTWGK